VTPIVAPHILIVEDNPDDETLLERALREIEGAPVATIVPDGVEALDVLRSGAQRVPDLMLIDLKMPRMTGFELLREVRHGLGFKHLPLVVFTSSDDARDIERAYDAGATAYVQKPLSFDAFTDALRAVVQFWLKTNEPPRPPAERLQRLL
jgi:two-component system, response regulator